MEVDYKGTSLTMAVDVWGALGVSGGCCRPPALRGMNRGLHQNLPGNEVDHANSLILLVKNMPCSKLQCQGGLIHFPFHMKFLFQQARGKRTSWSRLPSRSLPERDFFIDNLLVRIHFIVVMMRWSGLAPLEFVSSFPGSLTSTFRRGPSTSRH